MFLFILEHKTTLKISRDKIRDWDEKYFDLSCVVFENVIS